jgi:hypothetical protein
VQPEVGCGDVRISAERVETGRARAWIPCQPIPLHLSGHRHLDEIRNWCGVDPPVNPMRVPTVGGGHSGDCGGRRRRRFAVLVAAQFALSQAATSRRTSDGYDATEIWSSVAEPYEAQNFLPLAETSAANILSGEYTARTLERRMSFTRAGVIDTRYRL